ncbi:Crp/Fnr family transcriptional regulator [Cupriavidus sp. USMAA2-4]|uniref:Crp/Fnr family transcriptional regulator n=1 Tax=Cupriavidus malaysiensis TaxID=367825 RepID=A0ABM6FBW6_9BURK|nr:MULTISPECIES: Crp/Fnr family transcriptional regulator [Cupriavidus]AOY96203.1 Crp/Fnr family transcriptional regulator [Cupriavidus sp. USMAA2-4]AOZ03395.1 Crp/Fnr family transcriptional regulator [Cupriavidus sp. USMAHM13]AOZ09243.1 Crp/Fnr family transcriptional regulator [Cupriavidus malaysiensis]
MGIASQPTRSRPPHPTLAPPAFATVQEGAWFRTLPAPLREALLEDAATRSLAPGQALFSRGDPFDGLYCVLSGTVQVDAVSAAGKAALLGLLEAGTWFGEICLFDGLQRTHDAHAVSAASVLLVPREKLLRRLQAHPEWWPEFGRLLAAKTRQAFRFVEEAQLLAPLARTARRLAALAQGNGGGTGASQAAPAPRTLRIPQEQLAQMLGLSRQTVNQALRDLEARGLLRLHYAGIELLDPDALAALG